MKRLITAALIVTFFSGCSAYGPVRSESFETILESALPGKSEKIISYYPAVGILDFGDVGGFYPQDAAKFFSGVFVITNHKIYFAKWNRKENEYAVLFQVPLRKVKGATIKGHGLTKRLVIQKDDGTFDAFEMINDKGIIDNRLTTEHAFDALTDLLREVIKGNTMFSKTHQTFKVLTSKRVI